MSVKQDRTYARTAQDLERKYSFGKTFSDMLGLINDNRDKVDSVESTMKDEIEKTETELKRTTDEISAKVFSLSKSVEMKLDRDGLLVELGQTGVDKVKTTTGYELGSEGLIISKSGEEIENKLDNTGMYVKRDDDEILTANKDGVKAKDLHAKTYLIVGAGDGRSRFEDYLVDRTACFWVGG